MRTEKEGQELVIETGPRCRAGRHHQEDATHRHGEKGLALHRLHLFFRLNTGEGQAVTET